MKNHPLSTIVAILLGLAFLSGTAHAQVPNLLNYQGRVVVGTVNFNSPPDGLFKFALVDATGGTVHWTNSPDTAPADGVPDNAVSLPVAKGLYSVLLGDTAVTNMDAIPAIIFSNADVRLRVWFSDGTGFQLLAPDQRLAPHAYLSDGAVTSSKLADGAVGSAKLAPGTVFSWQAVSGTSQLAQSNTGYTANDAARVTVTLPVSPAVGDTVRVLGAGAGGWSIAPNAGQSVLGGSAAGTSWTPHGPLKNWFRLVSSADGAKLVAATTGEYLYASTDGGNTWTPLTTAGTRSWNGLASSADGAKLVAVVTGGFIYISTDSGASWAERVNDQTRGWQATASSADGSKLFAAAPAYGIFTSTDLNHSTWTPASGTSAPSWTGLACSADGTKLVAVANGSQIYTSADSGATWAPHGVSAAYKAVASSADGTKLVAVVNGGQIYTSADSGATWTARESARQWFGVASSASGANLVAVVYQGQVYTSTDSGVTWTPRDTTRNWQCVASSADGGTLAGGADNFDSIYISRQYFTGAQGSTAELQYVGDGQWQAMNQALIAAGAVGSAQIASGGVSTPQLADGAVTAAKIGAGQVVNSLNAMTGGISLVPGNSNISIAPSGNTLVISASGTVSGTASVNHNLTLAGDGTGTAPLGIALGGVGTLELAANAVDNGRLAANAVTGGKIAALQVVKSLNGLRDNVTLSAGPNITLTPAGNDIQITASGGSTSGWALGGNSGTTVANFLGTTDNRALDLRVNNQRVFRLEPNGTGSFPGPNVIGGFSGNSVTSGQSGNTISGGGTSGYPNGTLGSYGSIGGGLGNLIEAGNVESVVAGGNQNSVRAAGSRSTIGGGILNNITGAFATIAGGQNNSATGDHAAIGGGWYNNAVDSSSVAGGSSNYASGTYAAIAGGSNNTASGNGSMVGGGASNTASGAGATIPGGNNNIASGAHSLAAGQKASALHEGCFVWNDRVSFFNLNGPYVSTAPNQFCINASGGIQCSTSTRIFFGNTTRQMLNLWGTEYGVGVQNNTEYFRSAGNFAWYIGGTHNNTALSSGTVANPGATAMTLESGFLTVTGAGNELAYLGGDASGNDVQIGSRNASVNSVVAYNTATNSYMHLSCAVLHIFGGGDVAEPFQMSTPEIPKGSVVVIDDENPGNLKLSARAYDRRVAGIVSGANGINPGIALQQEGVLEGGQNVALSGRVYVQADTAGGPIKPGDMLTSSDTPGHAMKVTDHTRAQGAIIGKAMSSLPEGAGMVLVLVTLQ